MNLKRLTAFLFVYQPAVYNEKLAVLKQLAMLPLKRKDINTYHECLLFISAHPEHHEILTIATAELKRIANFLKQMPTRQKAVFNDSGLPYTSMITRFSCDILLEMLKEYKCEIELDSFEEGGEDLNTLLNLTLPDVLKHETTAGLSNLELMDLFGVKPKQRLQFLLNEFNKLAALPLIQDHLWESLKIYLHISTKDKTYARSFNCLPQPGIFFQNELLKKFDYEGLLQRDLPVPATLNETALNQVVATIRKSLLLTMRETDTSTYMEKASLRLFHLERGVSIAIYGMEEKRQLPYQSYIGYTAFKNGFPVAYGGSWVFGHTAMFGLNILESFRGGESGFIMCQLLRVYLKFFKLSYIEVESYQFGKDNPDGIKSGAFWFYYRYGFRPLDKRLDVIAKAEYAKISTDKNYRTAEKTLIALSESNIALNFESTLPLKKEIIFNTVLQMIATSFKGNTVLATQVAVADFTAKVKLKPALTASQKQTLEEVALWAKAFKIKDNIRLGVLKNMIYVKSKDAYAYNELIKDYAKIKG